MSATTSPGAQPAVPEPDRQAPAPGPAQPPADVIDTLLGITPGSPLARTRALRPEATRHTQGSYDALFDPARPATGVTPAERFAAARHVAELHGDQALAGHYAQRLADAGGPPSGCDGRLTAILAHAELTVLRPAQATPADLDALAEAGLGTPEIVTVSQLIAYAAYQVRLLAGLGLLRGDPPSGDPAARPVRGPLGAPAGGFTREPVGWTPWREPAAADALTDEQLAVLPGQRLRSPYFRLLAVDPGVLGERTAADDGIFHSQGGLPRAERELAATVASLLNGCVFCVSVHSRFASRFSTRGADVQRLLDEGVGAPLDDRWRAVTDLAATLTTTPSTAGPAHVRALRTLGLDDLDILDVVQAAAFFAWANRLMLTLGAPVPPAPKQPAPA